MRLFTALTLPDKTKESLFRSASQLSGFATRGVFVRKENYHITLNFLGETSSNKLIYIESAMDAAAALAAPTLSVCQITSFRSADLVCAKYKYDSRLGELHEKLAVRLEEDGFPSEHRAYRPHTTLVRHCAFDMPFSEVVKNVTVYNMPFICDTLTLYETVFDSDGVSYREVYEVKLASST